MQLFGTEIREAFQLVQNGSSVRVVGTTGSGKSTVVARLVHDLERSGHNVLAAKSLRSIQTPKYALIKGLGLTSLPREIDVRDESTVAAGLIVELHEHTANVLVVDDIDDIDSLSLTVLNLVLERTGTPIVYSTTQSRMSGVQRSSDTLFGLTQHATVTLPGLRYEAVSEYLHDLLGHAIDTEIVMRVFSKSAGNPLLINLLAENAVRQGRIALRDGRWHLATENLWTSHLEPTCRALLKGVTRPQQKALHTLALLGPRPLSTVTKLVSLLELEDLEDLGFIKLIGSPADSPVVVVSPPLIADYFQYRPATIRTVDVIASITKALGAGEKELLYSRLNRYSSTPECGPAFYSPASDDAVLSRFFIDRVSQSRNAHFQRWESAPTEGNALLYLGEIGDSTLDEDKTDRVFRGSEPPRTPTDPEHLRFTLLRAQWLAYHFGDLDGALEMLAILAADAAPELSHHAEAAALGLEVMMREVPTDAEERLERLASGPDPFRHALTVEALVHLAKGRPTRARHLVESLAPSDALFLRHFGDLIVSLSHVATGNFHTALDFALRKRTEAKHAKDKAGLYFNSYTAAIALVAQRRWDEAERLASSVLSLGRPNFMLGQIYDATLRIAAYVAAKRGRRELSESLYGEAARTNHLVGPLSAMNHSVSQLLASTTTDSQLQDYPQFCGYVAELEARGYLNQVVSILIVSLDVFPRPESVARLRALLPRLEMGAFDEALDLVEGLFRARSVRDASDVVTRFMPNGNEEFATRVISSTASYFRAVAEGDRALIIENTQQFLLNTLSVQGSGLVRDLRNADRMLSTRELEIALLVLNLDNQAIAERIGITVRAVENHISRAYRKTGATSRAELFSCAYQSLRS